MSSYQYRKSVVEIRRYIDFAKAFDKVDFMVTLKKLKGLGISGKVGKWIHSFLTNRSLVVLVRNARSQPMAVKSGVPQGSVLGPLLFLVLIGDIDQGIARAFYTPAQRSWRGGILDSPCPSVRPSVRPSVCRRHGFRSISQVCFGISISNFICMLMVAICRSLLIFSDVTFKMAAWWPYWIFWFPDSNFTLALNINFKLQRHNTYVYG